jgi:phage-related protein
VQELVKGVSFLKANRDTVVNVAEAIGIATAAYAAWKSVVFASKLVMDVASAATKLLTFNVTFSATASAEATAATEAQTVATEGLNTAMYLNPAGLVAAAVIGLAVGMYELYQHSATARRIMNELWADLKSAGREALGWIAHTGIPAVREAISGLVNWTRREWNAWGGDIKAVARAAWQIVKIQVQTAIDVIRNTFNFFNDLVHGRWSAAWHDAVNVVKAMVSGAVRLLGALAGDARRLIGKIGPAIVSIGKTLISDAITLGKNLVMGVVHGIESAPGDVAGAIKSKATSALSSVGSALGIGSPSKVFAQRIGKPISDGIVLGMQPLHDDMRDQMLNQMTRLQNQYGPLWHDQFHDNVGQPITRGIVAGQSTLRADLGNAIVNAAHGAIAHAKSALGISSPSKLAADQIGKPLADGIVHGMGGLEAALAKKITTAAQSAMSSASGGFGSSSPQGSAAIGYNQRLGYQMMLAHGWPASQWGALQALWNRESGWNANAVNSSSGAAGIPQALGHGHVFNLGDARAQIAWGLDYIAGRYGSPSAAWAHEEAIGWYGQGGVVPGYPGAPQPAVVHGGEVVFTPEQMGMLSNRGIHIAQMIVQTPSAADLVSELDHIARGM